MDLEPKILSTSLKKVNESYLARKKHLEVTASFAQELEWEGKRRGFILDLDRRYKAKSLPENKGRPKYSITPHPLLRLSRLALPEGANQSTLEKAVKVFSSSVTIDTQSGYATAARHLFEAEKALGRKFGVPPSEPEMIFLTTHLINQNLSVASIRHYLAGIRFYYLSMGIPNPPRLPPLAEQLLAGRNNQTKNPALIAAKQTKRAITIELLKLLGHAIACNSKWSDFEKNLRY